MWRWALGFGYYGSVSAPIVVAGPPARSADRVEAKMAGSCGEDGGK